MTGSIHVYNRQLSSTTGGSNMDKNCASKLRRWSSADDHDSVELVADNNQHKENSFFKREHTTNDVDSGTEEIEQQLEHVFIKTINDDEDEDQLSTKSCDGNADEGISECETSEQQLEQEEKSFSRIENDLELAKNILDELKKDFCSDTSVVFHAEFARLISLPLSLNHGVRFFLFTEEELVNGPYIHFDHLKLDNAKAQFKCPNTCCQHAWTSMRARISFSVSGSEFGLVVLKVFGQDCQRCGTQADALWYIDEVCRVMKNLAKSIFEQYFPEMMNLVDLQYQAPEHTNGTPTRHLRHDPAQRKGKMFARHVQEHCEACRRGLCFV